MKLIFILISATSFIFYGFLILISNHMLREFVRYKMERFRTLTGYLELVGGAGLLIGYFNSLSYLIILSALGLALLMFLGTIIRIRARDPWLGILPAFILMLINSYIVVIEILKL